MTVSELFERWQKVASLSLKATTYGHYVNALESYVLPAFGTAQIARIERYDAESFFARQATKYSRSTIRSVRISFCLLLASAVRTGWLKEDTHHLRHNRTPWNGSESAFVNRTVSDVR